MVRPMISSEFLEDELPDDFSNQKNIILNKFLNSKQERQKFLSRVKEQSLGDEGLLYTHSGVS